jgi:hypothetical protein
MVSACWVPAQNGLYLLDVLSRCLVFATLFVLGYPLPLLQGRCICGGSLSSPTAWLFLMLPEKPLQEA